MSTQNLIYFFVSLPRVVVRMFNDGVFWNCAEDDKDGHDALISMINQICKNYTLDHDVYLIGGSAGRKMDEHLFNIKQVYMIDNYTVNQRAQRLQYAKPHEDIDIDIRVSSHATAHRLIDDIHHIAATTKLLKISSQTRYDYGFNACIRLVVIIAHMHREIIDISFNRPQVYPLEDFAVRARVKLGQTTMVPQLDDEKLLTCPREDYTMNWIFRNNILLIPTEEKYQTLRRQYPESPSYMEMIYKQMNRWRKKVHRLSPNKHIDSNNRQEYLLNLCKHHIYVNDQTIYVQCYKCNEIKSLNSILSNRNTFAQYIFNTPSHVVYRCRNSHLHTNGHEPEPSPILDRAGDDPTAILYTQQRSYESKAYQCAICYTHAIDCQLKCGHLYCMECLLTWMDDDRSHTCPTCKQPIIIARKIMGDRVVETLIDTDAIQVFDNMARITARPELSVFPANFHISDTKKISGMVMLPLLCKI